MSNYCGYRLVRQDDWDYSEKRQNGDDDGFIMLKVPVVEELVGRMVTITLKAGGGTYSGYLADVNERREAATIILRQPVTPANPSGLSKIIVDIPDIATIQDI